VVLANAMLRCGASAMDKSLLCANSLTGSLRFADRWHTRRMAGVYLRAF
jgi:hypothetical protein